MERLNASVDAVVRKLTSSQFIMQRWDADNINMRPKNDLIIC